MEWFRASEPIAACMLIECDDQSFVLYQVSQEKNRQFSAGSRDARQNGEALSRSRIIISEFLRSWILRAPVPLHPSSSQKRTSSTPMSRVVCTPPRNPSADGKRGNPLVMPAQIGKQSVLRSFVENDCQSRYEDIFCDSEIISNQLFSGYAKKSLTSFMWSI
jgi:hypothetical protein